MAFEREAKVVSPPLTSKTAKSPARSDVVVMEHQMEKVVGPCENGVADVEISNKNTANNTPVAEILHGQLSKLQSKHMDLIRETNLSDPRGRQNWDQAPLPLRKCTTPGETDNLIDVKARKALKGATTQGLQCNQLNKLLQYHSFADVGQTNSQTLVPAFVGITGFSLKIGYTEIHLLMYHHFPIKPSGGVTVLALQLPATSAGGS